MFDFVYTICFDTLWRDSGMDSSMRLGGIYIIQNEVNDKFYVGSAKSFFNRFQRHSYPLKHNKHWNKHLQNSYIKYGSDKFTFNILEIVPSDEDLLDREQYWIDELNPTDNEIGYNISPIATPGGIWKTKGIPQETRDKISKTLIGRVGCLKGVVKDDAWRKKISLGVKKLKSEGYKLPQCRPVEMYDIIDDTTEIYDSISDVVKQFKTDQSTIRKLSHTNKLFRMQYLIKILK